MSNAIIAKTYPGHTAAIKVVFSPSSNELGVLVLPPNSTETVSDGSSLWGFDNYFGSHAIGPEWTRSGGELMLPFSEDAQSFRLIGDFKETPPAGSSPWVQSSVSAAQPGIFLYEGVGQVIFFGFESVEIQ